MQLPQAGGGADGPGGIYAAAADELARYLRVERSELRDSASWIRVRDDRRREVYRSSIDPDETAAPKEALA